MVPVARNHLVGADSPDSAERKRLSDKEVEADIAVGTAVVRLDTVVAVVCRLAAAEPWSAGSRVLGTAAVGRHIQVHRRLAVLLRILVAHIRLVGCQAQS